VSAAPPGAAPAATPAAAVAMPLRVKTLTLTDFRAFPGPAPQAIEFSGKNLLVYGENGAGKSSIFHALRAVFSAAPQRKRGSLADYKNKFSTPGVGCARVDVAFDGMSELASWTLGLSLPGVHLMPDASPIKADAAVERHPFHVMREPNRTAFRRATARAACLDYRALLDTNYRHGNEEINLFSVAVNHLLRDYDYTPPGGQPTTIGSLWDKVDGADKTTAVGANPTSHRPSFVKDCENLNEAIASALIPLQPLVNALLSDLGHSDLQVVNLAYGYVGPKAARLKRERGLMGGTLVPNVRYRGHEPARPQDFLNEARLSALALSIYFAGRLTCTPAVASDVLKLLVLDDVLIGLDHANRLPVLDLLQKHFATWQIVLLTHDRGWFDMARGWLDKDAWHCVEIFEGDGSATAPIPIVRRTANYPAKQYLAHAKQLLADHYVEASANYARQAFEAALRGGCQHSRIPVAFQQNTKDVKAEVLLQAVEDWAKLKPSRDATFEPVLKRLRLLRNIVLNPYSHPLAPNIPTTEVQGAIAEVEKLIDAFAGNP
jgi:energy-coupling factor transporter ATP-binding protein EcfA2